MFTKLGNKISPLSAIILAAILFGLVHPGGKYLIGEGLSLLELCLGYIFFRLVVQLPFVIRNRNQFAFRDVLFLMFFGLIGAGLQFNEFGGLSEGLPVGVVTFVLYAHPLWTIFIASLLRKKVPSIIQVISVVFCLLGVFILSGLFGNHTWLNTISFKVILFPIIGSLFLALWIILAEKGRERGHAPLRLSFYYDIFAFTALLVFLFTVAPQLPYHLGGFAFSDFKPVLISLPIYSILTGLLPNLLSYKALEKIESVTVGLILQGEPIIAASVAAVAFNETISIVFVIGAAFILFGNILNNTSHLIQKKFLKLIGKPQEEAI